MSRQRFMAAGRGHCPVQRLCLGAGRTGQWHPTPGRAGQKRTVWTQTPAWEMALVKAFRSRKSRHATRRLPVVLRQNGYRVGRQCLRTTMHRRGLHAWQPRAWWGIPTAAGNAVVRPTAPCSTSTALSARRADVVTAAITPRPKASGPGSKPGCWNYASGPFSPTWPMLRPAPPTILTATITTDYIPVSAVRTYIMLANNFFELLP